VQGAEVQRCRGLGLRVQGAGSRVQGVEGTEVWGLGYRVQGTVCRVEGSPACVCVRHTARAARGARPCGCASARHATVRRDATRCKGSGFRVFELEI
jgi:hypothetical protein